MFVEIVDYPETAMDTLLLVTTSNGKIVAATYKRTEGSVAEAPSASSTLPDLAAGNPQPLVSNNGGLFTKNTVVVYDPEDAVGFDEVVDYTLLDMFTDSLVWEPRLPQTKSTKLIYSARFRQLNRRRLLASLYIRFATGNLSETVVHLVNRGDSLVTDLVADYTFDGTTVPVGRGGAKWLEYMWTAEVQAVDRTGDTFEFSVKLRNADGSPCNQSTRLHIEADAGYLPKRTVTTDANGEATFTMTALGLASGDKFKVKLNTAHFTAVGKIEGTV